MSETNREILKEEKQWLIVGLLFLACVLFGVFAYTVLHLAFQKADEIKQQQQPVIPANAAHRRR